VSTSLDPVRPRPEERSIRGTGRAVFAATLLLLVGTINIIYGIGALDGANVFVGDQRYVLTDLNKLGWVVIVLGVVQLVAGFSLMAGHAFGRVMGIGDRVDGEISCQSPADPAHFALPSLAAFERRGSHGSGCRQTRHHRSA
jgi:hypothetical protein